MINIKLYKIGAVIITLVMLLSSTAFASTLPASKTLNNKENCYTSVKGENVALEKATNEIETKLNSIVKQKVITQSQENAIVKLATTQSDNDDIKTGLDSLIITGTITKSQENTIIKLFSVSENRVL